MTDRTEYWTDYPFAELGDTPGKLAPIRSCQPTRYDGDKYMGAVVAGVNVNLKRGYVYTSKGRCGEVPALSHTDAMMLFYAKGRTNE